MQTLRNRGYALSGDEDDLRLKLLEIERGMQDPALSARMEELWSRMIVLRNYTDNLRAEINKRGLGEAELGLGEEVEMKAKKVRGTPCCCPLRLHKTGATLRTWLDVLTWGMNRSSRIMRSRSSI